MNQKFETGNKVINLHTGRHCTIVSGPDKFKLYSIITEDKKHNFIHEKDLGYGITPLEEGKTVTITIPNLDKRNDIDDILQNFEHDIVKDNIIMDYKMADQFKKELEKRRIKI